MSLSERRVAFFWFLKEKKIERKIGRGCLILRGVKAHGLVWGEGVLIELAKERRKKVRFSEFFCEEERRWVSGQM